MYARVVEYTLKRGKQDEFLSLLRDQVLPLAKARPGFVDLMGWISDEHPEHAFAITYWNAKEDADRFYRQEAPMVTLLSPLAERTEAEHYFVLISTGHQIAKSQAA